MNQRPAQGSQATKPAASGPSSSSPKSTASSPAIKKADVRGLIPILGGKPGSVKTSKAASVEDYWKGYYKTHEESPEALREKVGMLNAQKKFRDVRAILMGYLTYHSKNTEPWMYEGLALSIKLNGGKEADIKQALEYATNLALESRNPNPIVSVADQLLMLGYLDRVGELLDTAAEMVPHRSEPLLMSINLAQRLKDPKRMGDSIDQLLSLGWPLNDQNIRRDARKQVDRLAKSLKEEGRDAEAEALVERIPAIEARDLFVRLTWVGDADLELIVDEPYGATASYKSPRTVFGGALVKNGYGNHPEEVYVCPRGFDGEYTIKVETAYNNPAKPAVTATLEVIQHEGTPEETKEIKTIKVAKTASETQKIILVGGRRKKALPLIPPDAIADAAMKQVQRNNAKQAEATPKSSANTKEATSKKAASPKR